MGSCTAQRHRGQREHRPLQCRCSVPYQNRMRPSREAEGHAQTQVVCKSVLSLRSMETEDYVVPRCAVLGAQCSSSARYRGGMHSYAIGEQSTRRARTPVLTPGAARWKQRRDATSIVGRTQGCAEAQRTRPAHPMAHGAGARCYVTGARKNARGQVQTLPVLLPLQTPAQGQAHGWCSVTSPQACVRCRHTAQRHRGGKGVVWHGRNHWVWKPSPEYKLNIVPRSGAGVDSRVGVESGTEMLGKNSEFNARALGC